MNVRFGLFIGEGGDWVKQVFVQIAFISAVMGKKPGGNTGVNIVQNIEAMNVDNKLLQARFKGFLS